MALCHPSFQGTNGKLRVLDAENAWFIRVDSVTDYGDDPFLEKMTIKASKPLLFLKQNLAITQDLDPSHYPKLREYLIWRE